MNFRYLLLILFFVLLFIDINDAWRRRRRRRRSCHPQNCHKVWGAWSACNCLGDQTRRQRVTRGASCGGVCPTVQTQHRKCYSGKCRYPYGQCNWLTKQCTCYHGTWGAQCQLTCPNGKYGTNCAQTCNCLNGALCDKATGYCRCPIGRYGTRCERSYTINASYKYYRYNHNTKCHLQERVSSIVVNAINICPITSHYVTQCLCGGTSRPKAYNLFYGNTCLCQRRVPNDTKEKAQHRNKFVTYSVCCPTA